ncbi:cysteinyl-tRNA synthetase [Arachnomyces sp. PD_36]|nr:cysteinyl-tRNA synthetase [Arachnomyces sp. PD_36]
MGTQEWEREWDRIHGHVGRNGSRGSSNESGQSEDTVTQSQGIFNGYSSPTSGQAQLEQDRPGKRTKTSSPHATGAQSNFYQSTSPNVSPTDLRTGYSFGERRKDNGASVTSNPSSTRLQRSPSPTTISADYPSNESAEQYISSQNFRNNGATQYPTQPSSSYRPNTAFTDYGNERGDRRPSVASAATASSQGSKSSAGARFRKHLPRIFGDDYKGSDAENASDTSLPGQPFRSGSWERASMRSRQGHSAGNSSERPISPGASQPRAPPQSSEVTPWMYQSFTDIPQYGDAPVREDPIGSSKERLAKGKSAASKISHQLHIPGGRRSRSKEDLNRPPKSSGRNAPGLGLGNGLTKQTSLNASTPMASSTTLNVRSPSPTPSQQSDYQFPHSPGGSSSKRSVFDRLRRHNPYTHSLRHLPRSTRSLQDAAKNAAKPGKRQLSPDRRGRDGSLEGQSTTRLQDSGEYERKKEGGVKGIGIGPSKLRNARLGIGHEGGAGKDGDRKPSERDRIWELDTDLNHMEGIVSQPRPLTPSDSGGIFTGQPLPEPASRDGKELPLGASAVAWDAPESWAVRKAGDDIVGRLPEIGGDESDLGEDEERPQYCVRVFRIDSTFATLSASLNTTVADILVMLGRKSFLQDNLNNYEIVMRRNDLSRQLDHGERPILMQKRLLEQAGYTALDRIEEIGREDNSYLCRFTFLPTKLSGYSSLENDPGFNKTQKFSHVDLEGRSMVTIPITLYKKASEIISLNLSRNLALDVPRDFIQSCVNLREIKYISNEAWRLPASISLASRLTYLDISNNRVEQLDHAQLDRLQGLVSIKMANNMLSTLPKYFGKFKQLRNLNLSSNNFQVLPEFLCSLPKLVDLDISFNSISELPKIGQLRTLERLWVTNNMLRGSFDETFTQLVSLKEIDARFNAITSLDNIFGLPNLEKLLLGHNGVSSFEGSFPNLRTLVLDHCPVTQFDFTAPVPTLTSLNIASAKLALFKDTLFENIPNLTKLVLNKNHFVSLSPQIGKLRKLEHFSISKNPLSSLPATIGCLAELKHLNLRECNLNKLPSEIWYCLKLESLNVSSNVLDTFPKFIGVPPQPPTDIQQNGTPASTPGLSTTPSFEELGKLEHFEARRPSQTSGGRLSVGGSPGLSSRRKGSVASILGPGGRNTSVTSSRGGADSSRKDSNFAQRVQTTFAGSLRHLYLADNRLEDDMFREITVLPELRVLNLSYNELTDLPQGLLRRWQSLTELYLSGNELSSLPSDDLEESSSLRVLHINANKFQVLPAELCKVSKLAILDVGSNSLKYNVSNWPYDWNWNWNRNLKYLNFSGNKRLEIKPNTSSYTPGGGAMNGANLTNFNSLAHLRILGLMDVTLTIPTIPDQTEDRRVRTSASLSGTVVYGMADSLGRNEHLSTIDMVVPRFRGNEMETLIGLFDGQPQSTGGSKVAKFLHEKFTSTFIDELKKLRENNGETALDALRRSFLGLNKDMAGAASKPVDDRESAQHPRPSVTAEKLLSHDDINSGGVATVLYLHNMDLYVANVGDAQAVLVQSNSEFKHLARNHDPAEPGERARIREAGGFVSRNGRLNDTLHVSRAFGYFQMIPAVIAAPHTLKVTLTEQDEMIILASRELWDYVSADVVVDVARAERADAMVASQKIRDLAIAYGATNKIMVMIIGVSDLKRREKSQFRPNMSLGPAPLSEDSLFPVSKRGKRPRDMPGDSRLARFGYVEPPTGELAIIFTDIVNSTSLWETYPVAMRSAIQMHNELFRRQLGIIGGYEVKTEGDAFMVSFATASAALLWCFSCQQQLLEAPWPTEILETASGQEVLDSDQNVIFRGLSVRMGIHWGRPVCEKDPITGRMDYFGPMVNRASRITAVADGGQIFVSADFITEIQRTLEAYAGSERSGSTWSEDTYSDDMTSSNIRRELRQLSSQGFEVKDMGERKLKGLENPESVYLMYPHALAGRLAVQQDSSVDDTGAPGTLGKDSQLNIDPDALWHLWHVALRLEMLCSTLENPGAVNLQEPELMILNIVKNQGGVITDRSILSLVEHQVTRIETCTNSLALRHLMSPFRAGDTIRDHAGPMGDLMKQLSVQLAEFKALKEQVNSSEDNLSPFANAEVSSGSFPPLYRTISETSPLTQTTSPDSPMFPIMGTNGLS